MHRAQDHPARERSARARVGARLGKAAVAVGVAIGGLWTATHGVAGVAWSDVLGTLRGVTLENLTLLAVIWVGGLAIYAVVLAAALPGLGVRRSLLLNLSGSAIANTIPMGGAVATALNWRMVRFWGHSNVAFVTFCVLTNALDVMTKLVLPVVAVAVLVTVSAHVPPVLWAMAGACAAALVAVLVVQAVVARPGRTPAEAGEPEALGRLARARLQVRESATRIRHLFMRQWTRLVPGSALYIAAQVALLYVSLRSVGLEPPFTVVLMAAAIERLGTLIPITPGGTGIAEIGTVAWLVAIGLDPVEVVAGVLLYRIFLIAMEIPVGGLLLGGWAWFRRGPAAGAEASA